MLDTWRMHSRFFSAGKNDILLYWIPWKIPCFQVTSLYLKKMSEKIVNIFHAHFLCVIWSSCKQNADAHRTSRRIRLTKLQFRQSIILYDIKIIIFNESVSEIWVHFGGLFASIPSYEHRPVMTLTFGFDTQYGCTVGCRPMTTGNLFIYICL